MNEIFSKIVSNSFKFESVTKDHIKIEIQKLNVKKWPTFACIPVTILKDCVDAYLVHSTNSLGHSLQTSVFPQKLKQAEVIPFYEKLDPLNKDNYRLVSLLPHLWKVFERIIYKQIGSFMESKLTKLLVTQHSLLIMLKR